MTVTSQGKKSLKITKNKPILIQFTGLDTMINKTIWDCKQFDDEWSTGDNTKR